MRDIFLVIVVFIGLGFTFRFPFAGVLLWEWFALMDPHQEAFGFARSQPFNLVIAIVTIFSWLVSKEPKRIPGHPIIILLLVFLAWTTFNSFFAFNPTWSWPYWDRTWRIFAFGVLVSIMATNRARIDALVWVAVISLLYYGVKGGVFTLVTGGQWHVVGPPSSIIGDNNQLALALLMTLPLVEYLRATSKSKIFAWGLSASMALTVVSILGSYSRGAYIAMAAIAVFALFHSKRKLTYIVSVAAVAVPALYFMPESFYKRLNTLNSVDSVAADGSFHGRWLAWQVAYHYAADHFPFGAGFYGPQQREIFNHYFPTEAIYAAHSIYFQVLGEHGFIGLALYLALAIVATVTSVRVMRGTKGPDEFWNHKLTQMIQVSLLAFFVGGAALSMAYYDLFIILICLLPQLSSLAKTRTVDSNAESKAPAVLSSALG